MARSAIAPEEHELRYASGILYATKCPSSESTSFLNTANRFHAMQAETMISASKQAWNLIGIKLQITKKFKSFIVAD